MFRAATNTGTDSIWLYKTKNEQKNVLAQGVVDFPKI